MSKCLNCGVQLSCGCKKRKASNGSSACASCLAKLELKLKAEKNNIT
jgi:hypothetical protein